jgi:hypothetical protein
VRQRVGDAGLLASDLVDEIAFARRRLGLVAERRSSRRVGFAERESSPREEPAAGV